MAAKAPLSEIERKLPANTNSTSLPLRMALSSVAGMGAACFCHPLDVIRVQVQIDAEAGANKKFTGPGDAARQIVRQQGVVRGLYPGLSAAFLRQVLYGSCRMGIFSFLLNRYRTEHDNKPPPLHIKMAMGCLSGGIGAFVGTPSEVALVRMGADSIRPAADRRGYTSVVNCLLRMGREEGVASLWTGAKVTVMRAMVMGSFQMGVYSETKQQLAQSQTLHPDGMPIMFSSAIVASFFANGACMPFDVVKSRIQNMPAAVAGSKPIYSGMVDCGMKIVKAEGAAGLWKGFSPAFLKLAPYTMLSLTFLEKLSFFVTGRAAL